MGVLRVRAFAKVNYALEVGRLRPDGYHDVSTVMQSISLADEVGIELAEEGFHLSVEPEDAEVGPPEENSVRMAWALLEKLSGRKLPARVGLFKRIPAGAGLGGASADAAATLYGLNELYGLGLSAEELCEVGVRIGADVPFCLAGGTALGEGAGELLTPLPAPPFHCLLVVKPFRGASTAEVYRLYDELAGPGASRVAPVVAALEAGDLRAFAGSAGNDLAPVTRRLVPEVEHFEGKLVRAGALGAAMSGSGTAVYGVFGSREEAERAGAGLRAPFAEVCEPVGRGVEVI